jgi:hypothetical protein
MKGPWVTNDLGDMLVPDGSHPKGGSRVRKVPPNLHILLLLFCRSTGLLTRQTALV